MRNAILVGSKNRRIEGGEESPQVRHRAGTNGTNEIIMKAMGKIATVGSISKAIF